MMCDVRIEVMDALLIASYQLLATLTPRPHASTRQIPPKAKFPQPDFIEKGYVISAFYRIFGQSFERLNQQMFWENDKDIGKQTVDLWRHEFRRRHTNPGVVSRIIGDPTVDSW